MFNILTEAIKRVTTPFNGVLNPHSNACEEVVEFQDEIFSNMEMQKPSDDKLNLKRDGLNIRKDIKKAVRAYHTEMC